MLTVQEMPGVGSTRFHGRRPGILVAALLISTGLALPLAAQHETGQLAAARDLYASARYEEALAVLNELRGGERGDRKSVEQYRSLCLLALGRTSEAETAIAAVITEDPTYRPGEAEASPSVRATFTDVRRRLLPTIAIARYVDAKATYDRREWAVAEEQFRTVLSLIDDPDTAGQLGDLRVLTAGFLELSARAAAPPPEPLPASPVAERDLPPTPPATLEPERDRIYVAEDEGISPPVVVKQELPSVPKSVLAAARPRGLLEVVIDEQGRVVSMTIRASIHPTYDRQVLGVASDWKYQPATMKGEPVKFRKLIQIALKR